MHLKCPGLCWGAECAPGEPLGSGPPNRHRGEGMGRDKLLEKTDREPMLREVVVFGERHEEFLRDLIEEVQRRTNIRVNKSTIVRTLIESVSRMGLEPGDISNVYRARRSNVDLEKARQSILDEIENIEEDLRLALIDEPTETLIIRQYRRNLRYQRERLKAVESALNGHEAKSGGSRPAVAAGE